MITRRLFESDVRRHFTGEVIGASAELHKLRGHAFVFNQSTNRYMKRPDLRTRLFSLGDAGLIVIDIPREVVLDSLE